MLGIRTPRRAQARRVMAVVMSTIGILAFAPSAAHADNPIIQTIYTADPAPLVYNGRVYLYTGHDEDNSTYFTMKDWRVWSSADMVNWTDHGSPLSLSTFSWASANAWAGQTIYRNGRFYWYVPVTNRATGAMAIGVAVSTSPTGPFTDALGHPLVGNGQERVLMTGIQLLRAAGKRLRTRSKCQIPQAPILKLGELTANVFRRTRDDACHAIFAPKSNANLGAGQSLVTDHCAKCLGQFANPLLRVE